ncbi:MAG: hypothetical protein QXJ28_01920 [Candidatus Pacearchaeota archaeon]
MKRVIILLLSVSIMIISISLILIYKEDIIYKRDISQRKPTEIKKPSFEGKDLNEISIGINEVNYVLNLIGFSSLNSIPITRETPKVEISIDGETFNSEIKDNKIITNKGESNSEDIRIIISKKALINLIINSQTTRESDSIKEILSSEECKIEFIEGYPKLLAKGYLKLYEKFK